MRLVGLGAGLVATGFMVGTMEERSVNCSMSTAEQVNALEARINALEVDAAVKTSSAFVFIKPHAVNDKVVELVKAKFAASGIKVTGEGHLGYKQIDEEKLIDTHYGAIANRAVKQKPSELIVQDKAKAAFQKAFGISWDDAVSQVIFRYQVMMVCMQNSLCCAKLDFPFQGLVYNATDACAKMGIDGMQLDKEWGKLKRGF